MTNSTYAEKAIAKRDILNYSINLIWQINKI